MKPEQLRYSTTHEWVHVDSSGADRVATVGISAFAVEQLTDLVYIDLPEVGRQVTAGEPFGEIESVKAVSDLYSPVSGEIIDVNRTLAESLETFSSDPYEAGWIIKVRVGDAGQLDQLLDYEAYRRQCTEQG